MDSSLIWVKQIALFKNLPEGVQKEIGMAMSIHHAKKGDSIRSDKDAQTVRFLLSGRVLVQRITSADESLFHDLILMGGIFGDYLLAETTPLKEWATVVSVRAVYGSISVSQLMEFMDKNPAITFGYIKQIGEKLNEVESRYVSTNRKNARSRLLDYIKLLASKEGIVTGAKTIIKNNLTHEVLASVISISRQTVTEILNDLRAAGILNYSRQQIEIDTLSLASIS